MEGGKKGQISHVPGLDTGPMLYRGVSVTEPFILAATIHPLSSYVPVTGWLSCCSQGPLPLRLSAK